MPSQARLSPFGAEKQQRPLKLYHNMAGNEAFHTYPYPLCRSYRIDLKSILKTADRKTVSPAARISVEGSTAQSYITVKSTGRRIG
jgi:hypothetical protein